GLDIEENAILRGNRSACFFALKEFNAAAADAQAALNVDKMYIKGYFRLSAALKGLGKVTEAAYVAKAGLEIDPGNVALRKIVASAIRETRISDAP
ncbi:HOP3, partial [Symbiodinium microadriaticum]